MKFSLFPLALAAFALATLPASAQQRPKPVDITADCAPCHGNDGIARDTEVPHLAGQNEMYLFNQLKAFHSGKRVHKEMKIMSRHMSEEEMQSIASYYAALPPR